MEGGLQSGAQYDAKIVFSTFPPRMHREWFPTARMRKLALDSACNLAEPILAYCDFDGRSRDKYVCEFTFRTSKLNRRF